MIEQLLQDIAARGWLVNQLYQHSNGFWSCRLRVIPAFPTEGLTLVTQWVEAASLEIVLMRALSETDNPKDISVWDCRNNYAPEPTVDLHAQLSHLLKPKTKGLARRV